MCTAKAAIRGRGWGDQTQLYKYNGNLLQLSTSARLNVLPAARISACGRFLDACGNGKSAGGKLVCQRVKKVADGQKENGCYKYLRYGTFHITCVTSEPSLLQLTSQYSREHILGTINNGLKDSDEASFSSILRCASSVCLGYTAGQYLDAPPKWQRLPD
jgi:hypothetical protein